MMNFLVRIYALVVLFGIGSWGFSDPNAKDNSLHPHSFPHPKHHTIKHHVSRNIYIDLGANNGDSITAFVDKVFTGSLANDGSSAVQGGWKTLLSRPDGTAIDPKSWNIIAFEANIGFTNKLQAIERNLTDGKYVSSIKIYNGTAISTSDGTIDFVWDSKYGAFSGATTMKESFSAVGRTITVPKVDIVTLFRKEHITVDDFVVVKVDIEGAEYDLVRRIITSGIYRYIDKLAVEW